MERPAETAGIIGSGNLAWSLAANLQKFHFSVEQVISRNPETAKQISKEFQIPACESDLEKIFPDLDMVFLCVPDDTLPLVAEKLKHLKGHETLFIHCSGASNLQTLLSLGENIGVMWPLQTFRFGRTLDLLPVPLFIESDGNALVKLREIAFTLSNKVIFQDSENRLKMHLAAVLAGNFSTFLISEAEKISEDIGAGNIKLFESYLKEVIEKSLELGPDQALTGPARRGDQETIKRHLQLLKNAGKPDLEEIYLKISALIGKKYS